LLLARILDQCTVAPLNRVAHYLAHETALTFLVVLTYPISYSLLCVLSICSAVIDYTLIAIFRQTKPPPHLKSIGQTKLDDLGLVAALEWMTDDLAKTREIDAHFEIVGVEQTLPAETRLLLFRIAQEALNNTKRHTQASRAVVRLEFKRDNLKMTVNDNGKGFELPKRIGDWASIGHLGLAGMQEQARLIGGKLAMQSEIGRGTTVAIEVPIKGSLSL
jgi:glucose-6-phosphate-specific signal transduction histidine kinase